MTEQPDNSAREGPARIRCHFGVNLDNNDIWVDDEWLEDRWVTLEGKNLPTYLVLSGVVFRSLKPCYYLIYRGKSPVDVPLRFHLGGVQIALEHDPYHLDTQEMYLTSSDPMPETLTRTWNGQTYVYRLDSRSTSYVYRRSERVWR
jgi:hypothetical protein